MSEDSREVWMRSHDPRAASWPRAFWVLIGLWTVSALQELSFPLATLAEQASTPLAQINGQAITADEVERALGAPLRKLEDQIFQLKRQKLEVLIADRLLAAEAAPWRPFLLFDPATARVTDQTHEPACDGSELRVTHHQMEGGETQAHEKSRSTVQGWGGRSKSVSAKTPRRPEAAAAPLTLPSLAVNL
jgi:hypothetical protein